MTHRGTVHLYTYILIPGFDIVFLRYSDGIKEKRKGLGVQRKATKGCMNRKQSLVLRVDLVNYHKEKSHQAHL